MPDINTSPFANIILERLPAIDRNATPLPGTDPSTFMASLTAVLTSGGWPQPQQGVAATNASSASQASQPTKTASTPLVPTAALDPMVQFKNIINVRLPSIDSQATPLPGVDPGNFVTAMTALFDPGGWHTAAPTSASTVQPASPSTPVAKHASASNSPVDLFEVLFGETLAGRKS